MKFDNKEKEISVVGEVESNNVGIDTSNIDFIVTILSTNLYSSPITSFIRETVSNAWDSHVEAGIKDPVIIELLEDTEGKYFCKIQDFGVGLSPERFNSIYKNIGSSTKRSSNEQIGGFGIGRFSALAYSDVVHITSNYNKIQYRYMMYKDGNSISIDLLHQSPTTETNGLEVKVEIKNHFDIARFVEAIETQLVYFENLYFIDSLSDEQDRAFDFNNFQIKSFDNFLVNNLGNQEEVDIVLGKVRYPLNRNFFTFHSAFEDRYSTPISLKFDIGDLDVTPNREEILYSQKNITKIQEKLDLSFKEILSIFNSVSNKDYDNLEKYVEALKAPNTICLLEGTDNFSSIEATIDQFYGNNVLDRKITLLGQSYNSKEFLDNYTSVMRAGIIALEYSLKGDKIYREIGYLTLGNIKNSFSSYLRCEVSSLKKVSKQYLREEVHKDSIINPKLSKNYFKKVLKSIKKRVSEQTNSKFNYKIVKLILKNAIYNLSNIPVFDDTKVPQQYILAEKEKARLKRANAKKVDWSENFNLYVLRKADRGYNSVTSDSKTHSLKDFSTSFKELVVYDSKDSDKLRKLFLMFKDIRGVSFIEVAPTKKKYLKEVDNFIELKDFMDPTKSKLLRKIGTVYLINKLIPELSKLYSISSSIRKVSSTLADTIEILFDYCREYSPRLDRFSSKETELHEEIYNLCEEHNMFDLEMKAVLEGNKDTLIKSKIFLLFAEKENSYSSKMIIPQSKINLIVDYLLARKLIRPDLKAAQKAKKETIFNINPDENN